MSDDGDEEEGEEWGEEWVGFFGPCTCEHSEEEHGWGSCDVDGCDCEAGWEE